MKQKEVDLDDILVPGMKEVRDTHTLRIYHRIFSEGNEDIMPPIIVTRPGPMKEYKDEMNEYFKTKRDVSNKTKQYVDSLDQREKDAKEVFEKVDQYGFWLLDGMHRSVSSTLADKKQLRALEVEDDSDVNELEKLVAEGELFSFPHETESLKEIRESFITYAMGYPSGLPPAGVMIGTKSKVRLRGTVDDVVEELVREENIPGYMVDREKW